MSRRQIVFLFTLAFVQFTLEEMKAQEKDTMRQHIAGMIQQATSMGRTPSQEALNMVHAARVLAKENEKDSLYCYTNYLLGGGYNTRGEMDSSFFYYSQLFKDCSDRYPDIFIRAKVNLSRVYCYTENFGRARSTLEELRFMVDSINEAALSLLFYYGFGVYYHLTESYDSMKTSTFKALKYAIASENETVAIDIYSTIGVCFSELEQYDSSFYYNSLAFKKAKAVDDSSRIMGAALNVGALYRDLEQYDSSLYYLQLAEAISYQLGDVEVQRVSAEFLSGTYAAMGNYKSALDKYIEYRDMEREDLGQSHVTALNEMEVKYETTKKENEIQQLKAQTKLEAAQRSIFFAIMVFLLIISVAVVYVLRLRNKTNKKLQQINRSKTNFYANVSHELKTPLTLIKGPVSSIIENKADHLDQETLADLQLVDRNTDQLNQLVIQLLDIARSEDGKLELEQNSVNIHGLIERLVEEYDSWIQQKEIQLLWEKGEAYVGLTDEKMLQKIIANLFSNALKFAPAGGKVQIQQKIEAGKLTISIEDSGAGIDAKDQAHVFDRFYKSNNQTTTNVLGSGIGLAIVREFAELLEGTVDLTTSRLGGAKFTIQLPFPQSTQKENVAKVIHQPKQAIIKVASLERRVENVEEWPLVLVIDDHPDIRSFIRKTLEDEYRIIEAEDGKQGYELAKEQLPDVIISDIMMPKVDGIELLKLLKSSEETDYMATLMLTARGSDESRIKSWEEGANAYLAKPFNSVELKSRIKNILENRQKLRKKILADAQSKEVKPIENTVSKSDFEMQFESLVEQKLADPDFSFSEVLSDFAMSRSTFQRSVKEHYNCSPLAYLKEKRLLLAKELLLQKEGSIADVGYAVGFNSISYFNRAFKEQFGKNPTEVTA